MTVVGVLIAFRLLLGREYATRRCCVKSSATTGDLGAVRSAGNAPDRVLARDVGLDSAFVRRPGERRP